MPELTAQQSSDLADQALILKSAAGEFRNHFFRTLTPEQQDGLRALTVELGDNVDHLTAVAIKMTLADLQDTMARLNAITGGVNQAVAHLSEVRKILTVASSLVDLGGAIASRDPGQVGAALAGAVNSIAT